MAANIFLSLPGGRQMPILGLGTWQATNPTELVETLNEALNAGYRLIDTGSFYDNEILIGNVFKEWFSSGKLKREELFITTKLPVTGVNPGRVELFMKKSLENLQLDYVDLYLVHGPIAFQCDPKTLEPKLDENGQMLLEGKTDHAAVWKEMEEQVDAGRTKLIGLANYNMEQIKTILKSARVKPAILQIEMHVFMQQRKLVDFCKKNGIIVVAYSPLASPGFNNLRLDMDKNPKQLPDFEHPTLEKIAKKHSKSAAQVAVRFLIQLGVAPIPKSGNLKRVQDNMNVFDFNLDTEDMEALENLEVGPSARVCDFDERDDVSDHPDYPFKSY